MYFRDVEYLSSCVDIMCGLIYLTMVVVKHPMLGAIIQFFL